MLSHHLNSSPKDAHHFTSITSFPHRPVTTALRPDFHHPISPDELLNSVSSSHSSISPAADLFCYNDDHDHDIYLTSSTSSSTTNHLTPLQLHHQLHLNPNRFIPNSRSLSPYLSRKCNPSNHHHHHSTSNRSKSTSPLIQPQPQPQPQPQTQTHSLSLSNGIISTSLSPIANTISSSDINSQNNLSSEYLITTSYQPNAADLFLRSGDDEYNNDYNRDFD